MIMQMDKWLAYYAALAKEKFRKANAKQAGTDWRTTVHHFNIYQCSAGIWDQDRTGGDTAGRIYQRCGSGSYGEGRLDRQAAMGSTIR